MSSSEVTPLVVWRKDPEEILEKAYFIIGGKGTRDQKLFSICKLLKDSVTYYDWVGFYLVDPGREMELCLGPFLGAPTEHTRIPFGQGICGQAAITKELFLVPDVSKEFNYLSCSPEVRSEIVIPITREGRVLGELDIDSHSKAPFGPSDEKVLTKICERISDIL